MAERFPEGSTAYTKDGRAYTVEEVAGGIVYCSLPNGTETDFPESALLNASEWAARSGGQDEVIYNRVKRAKGYAAPTANLNTAAAEKVLSRADGLSPGLLDFTAFTIATQALQDSGHEDQIEGLSIIKCRNVFDEHPADVRAGALALVLGTSPGVLIGLSEVGDNLIKAMVDKGLAARSEAFEDFCDRPRR